MPALFGREGLLVAVAAALPGPVWLWGAPGVGRTRLLQELRARWEGPSVWVDAGTAADLREGLARRVGTGAWAGLLVCVDDADGMALPDLSEPAVWICTGRTRPTLPPGWTALEVPPLDTDGAGLALFATYLAPWYPDGMPAPVRERAAAWVRGLGGTPAALAAAAGMWAVTGEGVAPGSAAIPPSLERGLAHAWEGLGAAARGVAGAAAGFVGAFSVDDLGAIVLVTPGGLAALVAGGWVRVDRPGWLRMDPATRAFVRGRDPEGGAAADRHVLARAEVERAAFLAGGGSRAWLLAAGAHLTALLDGALVRGAEAEAAAGPPDGTARRAADARVAFLALGAGLGDAAALLARAEAVVTRFPEDAEVFRELARARRACGDAAGARAALETALRHTTDDAVRAALLRELGVVHQRARALDAAAEAYEASLAHAERVVGGDVRAVALAHGNLGAVAHDRHALPEAATRYALALDRLRGLGDARMEAVFLGNRGLVHHELGACAEARRDVLRGLALLEAGADPRLRAILLGNLGTLELEEGHPDEAAAHHHAALRELRRAADASSEALAWARLAAAEAGRGDIDGAADAIERAERRLAGTDDHVGQRVVELFRAFVALARGRRREAADRLAAARSSGSGPALTDISDDARLAARLLERRLLDRGDALAVGIAGAWFSLPGLPRVDLGRLQTCARVLDALVARREAAPGEPVDRDALVAAGWPGERIQPGSATNRLNVTLARLRAEGLRDALLHVEGGWLLDPAWPLLRVREEAAGRG